MGDFMIDYSPFWDTLKNSNELITKYNISSATIDKLRKNKPMNTTTLNDLCRILNCRLEDVASIFHLTKISLYNNKKEPVNRLLFYNPIY